METSVSRERSLVFNTYTVTKRESFFCNLRERSTQRLLAFGSGTVIIIINTYIPVSSIRTPYLGMQGHHSY